MFALGVAWRWELPHYESLAGGFAGADRVWVLGTLWAKSLIPVGILAALAVPPLGFARWRWGWVAFCVASGLGLAWLVTDLWTQLRYGAEAASYLPFVLAAGQAGAAAQHWQWMGNPLREIASLGTWLGLAAAAFAVLWVGARRFWSAVATRGSRGRGRLTAATLVWGWFAAIGAAAWGVNGIDSAPARERLVFYLPAPFATPPRLLLSRSDSPPCDRPAMVGVVPESWHGDHHAEVVVENPCATSVALAGWTIATPRATQGFAVESIAPGSQETAVMSSEAIDRSATEPVWVELRSPGGTVVSRVEFVPRDIKRGELIQGPRSAAQPLNRVRLAALEGYRDYFSALHGPLQPEVVVSAAEGRPPNVLVIVLDSFRADVASRELMPGLDRLARTGVRGTRHYSGSNSSHLGLFTLLYGRSALAYDAILDRAPKDGAPTLLRALGYRTSFLSSGGIESWKRMDDYLNDELFDEVSVFRSASEATWKGWPADDQRVLDAARERIAGADRPAFVLAFLMSLHFPYPYDKRHERFGPVSHEVEGRRWRDLFRARLDREQLWNRYRNSALGVDSMLAAFLTTLDLDDTIVVITGDHGESFGEDGALVHGSRGSDAQTQVPLILLGPGIPARTLDRVTSHVDVLPTILHLVSGADVERRFEGRDLLRAEGDHPVFLRLYRLEEPTPLLVVRRRGRLLLRARTDAPEIDVLGVVDDRGLLVDTPADFADGEWGLTLRHALSRAASAARSGATAR